MQDVAEFKKRNTVGDRSDKDNIQLYYFQIPLNTERVIIHFVTNILQNP